MKEIYINGIGCVSAQDTSKNTDFESYTVLKEDVVYAFKPNYRNFIQPALIRRMSTSVKMGVVASGIALKEANLENPDAIVSGTGMGCVRDSDKFLKKIIDDDEQFLTPTPFIQSTHNTVGAQIALGLGCKSYNVTYVHSAVSFESSLLDAQLLLNEDTANVLVGGVDEIGEHTVDLYKLIDHVKKLPIQSNSKGAIFSEGAQFFVLENEKKESSYAKFIDVAIFNSLERNKIEDKFNQFLKENDVNISDIDVVVLGTNDDVEFDGIYTGLQESIFKNIQQLHYKHLSGEYHTSSAFGMWTACQVLKNQQIPAILKLNQIETPSIKNILLYNQYRGEHHSFTLLSSC